MAMTVIADALMFHAALSKAEMPQRAFANRLRRKLSVEPQIRCGKQTRLVFTDDGEGSVPR
jgi:hypothetical protein